MACGFSTGCGAGGGSGAVQVMMTSGCNTILVWHGGSLHSLSACLSSLLASGAAMSFPFCTLVQLAGPVCCCHRAKSSHLRLSMHSCADKDEGVNMLVPLSKRSGWVSHVAIVYLVVGCGSEILLLNTVYINCTTASWLGLHLCHSSMRSLRYLLTMLWGTKAPVDKTTFPSMFLLTFPCLMYSSTTSQLLVRC